MILAILGHEPSLMDFIRRDQATTDEQPPWAGISFKWDVDSDHLADVLKKAYPNCRTLRERKHKATIDFLLQELDRMRAKEPATPTTLPSADLRHRNGSETCIEISPDRGRPASVSESTSPSLSGSLPSPSLSEPARLGVNTTNNLQQPSVSNTVPQQLVWNAHNGQPMRPKTKRKMTPNERESYKKTREQGACDPCRKQKARCTHVTTGADLSPVSVDRSIKVPKRKPPTPVTNGPAKVKKMKVEYSQHPAPQQSEVSQSHAPSLALPRDTPGEPPTEPMTNLGSQSSKWGHENGYVESSTIGRFPDAWPSYTTPNYMDPSPSGYTPGFPSPAAGFHPDMASLNNADFTFPEGYTFLSDGGLADEPNLNPGPT